MDLLAVTDFPDIRYKAAVQSEHGNLLVIPREGGYLLRLYVEMDKLGDDERVAQRGITVDQLIAAAQRILHPYTLEVKEVPWWSVYEIGQRICDQYDDVPRRRSTSQLPRVFIAGDACHTHSPKAGQGMNFSMQDTFNLGWKLASVLRGQARPQLLHTYSTERQAVAQELIDFDREWAQHVQRPARSRPAGVRAASIRRSSRRTSSSTAASPPAWARTTRRRSSRGEATHQHLATGFVIGTRFHSAPVVRVERCAAAAARPCGQGRRALAAVRLCRRRRPGQRGRRRARAVPLPLRSQPIRRCAATRRRGRTSMRCSTCARSSSQRIPTWRSRHCRRCCCRARAASACVDYEKVFSPDLKNGPDIFDAARHRSGAWGAGGGAARPVRRACAAARCASGAGGFFAGFMLEQDRV